MNQWQPIPAKCLCSQHLRGIYGEHHKHAPGFCSGKSIKGYLDNHCIAPATYQDRYSEVKVEINRRKLSGEISGDLLTKEIKRIPTFDHLPESDLNFMPDLAWNVMVLSARCDDCAERLWGSGYFI